MLDLDFQPRRPGPIAMAAVGAGALLVAAAWLDYLALYRQEAEVNGRLAETQRHADRQDAARRENRPEAFFSPAEAAALRHAYFVIGIDWERLYATIDAATSEDVALVQVRPDVAAKSVHIAGEARDMAAALAFVEALGREPLRRVILVSHQVKHQDPQQPIVFEVSATWNLPS